MWSVEETGDAWLRTIGGLISFSQSTASVGTNDFAKPFRGETPSDGAYRQKVRPFRLDSATGRRRPTAIIKIIERPTNSTLVVHWTDPGKCLYGYQIWRRTRATRRGYCALSGKPVRKHDVIFRPSWMKSEPQNSGEVILEAAVYRMSDNCSEEREVPLR